MNLVVDIGNSFMKVAVVDGNNIVATQRVAVDSEIDVESLKAAYPALRRSIVASSGVATSQVASALRCAGLKVLEMCSTTPVPIGNDYLTPATLGVDRLAAAVGVVKCMGYDDCLIVDFGTAITIDLVEGGVFRGGNISPGMRTRFRALHDYTQRLPECDATDEILPLGRTTQQAIEQGVMQGIVNEIEGYISSFRARNAKIMLIFTGGDANFFVNRIKNAIFAKCDPVVCGLNTILEYNASIEDENF